MEDMKTLTKAEEQIMQILWEIKQGFLKEIVECMPEPKPHSNTVATLLKILVEKDFADYKVYGRQHQYYAKISKEDYSKGSLQNLVSDYFAGSYKDAVSFLVDNDELSVEDLEFLLKQLKS
ncbi:MAG: BlaI/MecI/CopY family transcriptional regulator [Weeksellaceae bacterium]|nr:BlaI/MecI/CopY family transcriptional regulator [Weeksellaceae bacterium]